MAVRCRRVTRDGSQVRRLASILDEIDVLEIMMDDMPDGLILVVKRECPTCTLIEPAIQQIADTGLPLTVYTQDDPTFPTQAPHVVDDRSLEQSYRHEIETVPTLIRIEQGCERGRSLGWHRQEWQHLTGLNDLGLDLPAFLPGCGSKSVEPGIADQLRVRFGDIQFHSRPIEVAAWADPIEQCFERGWSDGLPLVPPTKVRVLRMLDGTNRSPDDILGEMPPNLTPCTVEKVAINAVMAGCKPAYMPVVLAAVEAALDPSFTLHGLICSTCFSGPVVIVNGPIAKEIGMNAGIGALGPGNRANATIGRALQLIIRNVGGGLPGEIDRSTLGSPGKFTFCFAEDESNDTWEPLSVSRGVKPGVSAVTLFQGEGIQGFTDQRSRTPEALTRSLSMSLQAVGHPKLAQWCNAVVVLSPEHFAIYREAGWARPDIQRALEAELRQPGRSLVQGNQGVGEGISEDWADRVIDKFPPGGLLLVRAGGEAGLFSAILSGWSGGRFYDISQPVTQEITP